MYKNAMGGGHTSALTKAEWRIYRYRAIKAGKKLNDGDPDWLKNEMERFGHGKWLAYFDRKTGRKKAAPLKSGKRLTPNFLTKPDGNLFVKSRREPLSKKPRRKSKLNRA